MSNNIFSSEELGNMFIIIHMYRNSVPDELNRDLRIKLDTICEKIVRLKEQSGSARDRGEEQPGAGTSSHDDVIPTTQPQHTSTPQLQHTSTPQLQHASTPQMQPTPQSSETTLRRLRSNTDDAQPGTSRQNAMGEVNTIVDGDNETVSSGDEGTSAPNLRPPPARIAKRRGTVLYKTFVSGSRGVREGLLTFFERKVEQGKYHGKSDEVICDIIISLSKDKELQSWAKRTKCKDTNTLLKYITSIKK